MTKKLFERGFKAAREDKERIDKEKKNRESKLYDFFLSKDGDEADVVFLTEEPVNYYGHNVPRKAGNKTYFDFIPCIGDDCPYCEDGDRPSYKGAFLIIDTRPYEYEDKKSGKKKVIDAQIKRFSRPSGDVGQLDRISTKYGLAGRLVNIYKSGEGQGSRYVFEKQKKVSFTEQEIEQLLPEALREMYDGSMDSLYDILEYQISLDLPKEDKEEEDEDDDKDIKRNSSSRRGLVKVSDDEDDDYEEDEDEDEVKQPRKRNIGKKPPISVSGGKKSSKPTIRRR